MKPEYAEAFHILLDAMHLEEVIRMRRRMQKRGHLELANYLSLVITKKEELEHREREMS